MLQYLTIKNFALIENCEIEIGPGMNIISGETGSGKSIIIQALGILLGGRASVEHIRSGVDEAIITGTIDAGGAPDLVTELAGRGIPVDDDELLLRRVLTRSGKSRSFINGNHVTSRELQLVFSRLFDFHGQHDGVSLLRRNTHRRYLDLFCGNRADLDRLADLHGQLQETFEQLAMHRENEQDKEKRLELLQYEIEEIESAALKPGEDDELKEQIKIFENYEKLMESLGESRNLLSGQQGVLSALRQVKLNMEKTADLDKSWMETSSELSDIYYRLEDVSQSITAGSDPAGFEPGKLDELIERSEFIEKLKRKYGGSIESVQAYGDKARRELEVVQFSSEKFEQLQGRIEGLVSQFTKAAVSLSNTRRVGATQLEQRVKQELTRLSMEKVEFSVKIESLRDDESPIKLDGQPIRYGASGIDAVEFLISPNLGEPVKSLSRIASGGELSRIILALKTVLAENDDIETMIFDEIDAGIGGKVAVSVGHALRLLSTRKQIICITHLPQIAAAGTALFNIQKGVSGERTVTNIERLDTDAQLEEIARMLSGHITENSLQHAQELLTSMRRT
jgi:DNA repair protein RecN (Recombination protein N)